MLPLPHSICVGHVRRFQRILGLAEHRQAYACTTHYDMNHM